ncbi:adenosylcobinamide amidohydrolase [Pseudooceanicola nitratireducens]|uniref:adenosylcobinamide amidohydrolase n=1 Tax=Pseudooceanicola nitratireducens TaxID=517719 RepID=UPI001C946413|nr:adenosylcobinamide amidohydrolase [Pseudooceanicola nitratireducens]MBY6156556.1 adenosylcobinamide amidohydrolase [Pseudooceanicola nitratireducens]
MTVVHSAPWLDFDLGAEMQVLSHAPHRPGFVTARRILWREVRNADLPPRLDARDWLAQQLAGRDATDAVCFLTSRSIASHVQRDAQVGTTRAVAVATVGLSNAERVGTRLDRSAQSWGTINIAVRLNRGLTPDAMIEALTIIAQARTAAVIDAGVDLPTGRATGTGTDCIAMAAPRGPADYTGLHTDIGEAIGHATYAAVLAGARDWIIDNRRRQYA